MAQVQTLFFFFLALLLSTIHIRTSLVHAIRSHQKQKSETSVLSLPLHPRHSIIKGHGQGQHQNYTARAISRLAGDKARAKYINSRLQNALFGSDPNSQVEDIESQVTSQGGDYVARVGVGQPESEFYLVADTGSEVTWLQCSPCSSQCSQQIFDPTQSSSYQPLSCASPQCNALPSNSNQCGGASTDSSRCSYRVSYGDQSFATGEFATETLSFDGSGSVNNMAIGCAHEIGGNMGSYDGILGLGPNPVSFPSQIKATSFSYCLVNADSKSSSTLDFNSAAPADSVKVHMLRNPSSDIFYYVELTGITVGEDQIPVPDSVYQFGNDGMGGVIVDSGTTLTYLDSEVYGSVRDAFQKNAQSLTPSQANVEGLETCYNVPSGSSASGLPAMSFQFSGGLSLPMGPENYFIRTGDSTICLAFQRTNQPVSIIGNIHQHGMRVTYDLENSLIGFSPNKC